VSIGATDTRKELKNVWWRPFTVGGEPASVHVPDLNNDEFSSDDIFLWHYKVPDD
jgi:hypothetical protein